MYLVYYIPELNEGEVPLHNHHAILAGLSHAENAKEAIEQVAKSPGRYVALGGAEHELKLKVT